MVSSVAFADSCRNEAGNKKLAGAAMNSFMKKCESDAAVSCDKAAAEKKIGRSCKDQLYY